ncbi:hypothetical protein QTP88_025266 [Uroleucon formosanum]
MPSSQPPPPTDGNEPLDLIPEQINNISGSSKMTTNMDENFRVQFTIAARSITIAFMKRIIPIHFRGGTYKYTTKEQPQTINQKNKSLFGVELRVIHDRRWKQQRFYDDNDDVLLLLFGQLIYYVPGRNRRTGKYIFIEEETERRKRTSLVHHTMIHIIRRGTALQNESFTNVTGRHYYILLPDYAIYIVRGPRVKPVTDY